MEISLGAVIIAAVFIALAFILPRLFGGNYNVCTRCEGTGFIDERWPDPSEPSGFHEASGKCPRCKGKGKVRV
ncbi:MAG: hypothetical protein HY332_12610 [Chloroflexi bacterium]|nr:hypothetical protein [Chloroflexota bacterium]